MVLKKEVIDAFEYLGLTPGSPQAVAEKAYKKLALKHHPDRNHGDPTATERFQDVRIFHP
jgi:curved DNA-binding protein CbpA